MSVCIKRFQNHQQVAPKMIKMFAELYNSHSLQGLFSDV